MLYVALFKGINVGGKHIVKMTELSALFNDLGFTDVNYYIQSGNVVFVAKDDSLTEIVESIERLFLERFGFFSKVFVYPSDHFKHLLLNSPYTGGTDYFTFLERSITIAASQRQELLSKLQPSESFECQNDVLYFNCPEGYGKTKLTPAILEKVLKVQTTTRNRKTAEALVSLISKTLQEG